MSGTTITAPSPTGSGHVRIAEGGLGVFHLDGLTLPGAPPTRVKPNRVVDMRTAGLPGVSPWGKDNNYPKCLIRDVKGSPFAMRLLKARQDAHYGKGLTTYKVDLTNGKRAIHLVDYPPFTQFSLANNLPRTLKQLIADYEWLRNPVAEVILTKDSYRKKKRIAILHRLKSANFRWHKKEDGRSSHIFYSANWPYPMAGEYAKIPALDVDDPYGDLMSRKSGFKFALAYRLEDIDTDYYDRVYWDAIRDGWLEIAKNVPRLKMAIMRNSIMAKYIIHIPFSYWRGKHPGWDDFDPETQEKLIDELISNINAYLTDVDNYGKSVTLHYEDRPELNGSWGKIEIKALDQPIKDTIYLPDSQTANEEISTAFGVDPAIIGAGLPGSKRSEGSGANKREGYTIHQALIHPDREATLFFPRFVARVNEWDPNIHIGYMNNDISDTLDKNPTGQKTTA